jgi:DNA repair exonuclease SbcCD nuclease subunit
MDTKMKLLLTTDWHIRSTPPENRIDDWEHAQEMKIKQILWTAVKEDVYAILCAGDITDSPTTSYYLFQKYLSLFKDAIADNPFLFIPVFGQHDLRYRTSKDNTPLYALMKALGQTIADANSLRLDGESNVAVYGVSYGEDIPTIMDPNYFNILLIHKLIVEDKLWAQQENVTWGNGMLFNTKYDLIVSGDNHKQFWINKGNRHLFNMGSLMRMKSDQGDHKPAFVIFDTVTRKYKIHPLEIEPFETVMNMEKVEKEKEKDAKIAEYITELKTHKDMGLNFEDNLIDYLGYNAIPEDIQDIIKETLHG